MIRQTPGKIFLAEQRGLLETSQFRRYSTFSFGPYAEAHKGPFGALYAVNEETLAGQHYQEFTAAHNSYVLLLPITGSVGYSTDGGGADGTLEVEQLLTLAVPAGTTLRLTNPYQDELISFLHLWVQAAALPPGPPQSVVTGFGSHSLENQLRPLTGFQDSTGQQPEVVQPLPFILSLGRFAGRHEAVYRLAPEAHFFAFVLAGAFEVEGRLLHEKDGLALWDVAEVELEALSNNALVLVLELQAA